MRDAKDQKMDLIICASISRFARNFSDCMTQIAALKTMHPAHPIGVYFETENIYTLNPSSQYSLDIQALLADWESGNKSRRMILSYDQRIMTGQYPVADLMGYRHTKLERYQCRKYPQPLPEHLSAGRGGETEQDGRNAVWKEVGYGIVI